MKKFFFFALSLISLSAVAAPADNWVKAEIVGSQSATGAALVQMYAQVDGDLNLTALRPNPLTVEDMKTDGATLTVTAHKENGSTRVRTIELANNLPGVAFGLRDWLPNVYNFSEDGFSGVISAKEGTTVKSVNYGVTRDGNYITGAAEDMEDVKALKSFVKAHTTSLNGVAGGETYIFLPKGAYTIFGLDSLYNTDDCYFARSTRGDRKDFKDYSACVNRETNDLTRSVIFLPRGTEIHRNARVAVLDYDTKVTFTTPSCVSAKLPAHQLKDLYEAALATTVDKQLTMQRLFASFNVLVGMLDTYDDLSVEIEFFPELVDVYSVAHNAVRMHVADFEYLRAEYPNAVAIAVNNDNERTLEAENVLYNGYCANFVLTDLCEVAVKDHEHYVKFGFVAPDEFVASNLYYTRHFNGGYASICLPFGFVATDAVDEIYTFAGFDPDAYSLEFNLVEEATVAGMPYFLKTTAGDFAVEAQNVLVVNAVDAEAASMAGTFVATDAYAGKLSVMANNELFAPLANNLYAFRACCTYDVPAPTAGQAAPRLVINRPGIATGVDNMREVKAAKVLVDGKIVIRKANASYDVTGRIVK